VPPSLNPFLVHHLLEIFNLSELPPPVLVELAQDGCRALTRLSSANTWKGSSNRGPLGGNPRSPLPHS
jgi:hypothetical protein